MGNIYSRYVAEEKLAIAEKYLIPQVEELTGLNKTHINLSPEGLNTLIKSYCRESGVRSLRKQIEKIYRKVATRFVKVEIVVLYFSTAGCA